ncbi:MAG TPA: helix-turn-helix domain-containing protein [Nocardioidaceae bacterium]|nr:helix-turn-helix domain-containing protein [Nocardioidaceae bacterium]
MSAEVLMTSEDAARLSTIDPTVLGERIGHARRARGLTQADVAGAEITAAYLSRIEDGQRRPGTGVLVMIARRLGLTPRDLLVGEEPSTPSEREDLANRRARRVVEAVTAWLADATNPTAYGTLVRSVDEWRSATSAPSCDTCNDTGRVEWMVEVNAVGEMDDDGKVPCLDCTTTPNSSPAPDAATSAPADETVGVTAPQDVAQRAGEDPDGPECETCGKTTCPDAALESFSAPVRCAYAPVYEALRAAKDCDYGCARDLTNQGVRMYVIPAVEALIAGATAVHPDAASWEREADRQRVMHEECHHAFEKASEGLAEATAVAVELQGDLDRALAKAGSALADRDYWKRIAESHGPCVCNTGPSVEGPDEYCPQHGRRYDDVLARLVAANQRADAAEALWAEAGEDRG